MKTLAAILACALASAAASAGVVTINGDTSGQPTFRRPLAGTPPLQLSPIGTAVRHQAIQFQVSDPGAYTLVITDASTGYDTFMHLYSPVGFNPLIPILNCLAGDDDAGPGSNAQIVSSLGASATYTAVVSGFNNDDFGQYTLEIRGPGNITLVPTPASAAILGALTLTRRKRRA